MRKLWNNVLEWLPIVWGILICIIITGGLVTSVIAIGKWLLTLLGVM